MSTFRKTTENYHFMLKSKNISEEALAYKMVIFIFTQKNVSKGNFQKIEMCLLGNIYWCRVAFKSSQIDYC